MKPKALKLLEQCIENGVEVGLSRAYKHNESPTKEQIQQAVEHAVLYEIHEWFEFDQEDEQ